MHGSEGRREAACVRKADDHNEALPHRQGWPRLLAQAREKHRPLSKPAPRTRAAGRFEDRPRRQSRPQALRHLQGLSRFERGSNLSGRVLFAQRSTVARFQRRFPLTCASGSGKSSRLTYRQTLGRLTWSISAISGTPTRSSGLTSTRLLLEADSIRLKL